MQELLSSSPHSSGRQTYIATKPLMNVKKANKETRCCFARYRSHQIKKHRSEYDFEYECEFVVVESYPELSNICYMFRFILTLSRHTCGVSTHLWYLGILVVSVINFEVIDSNLALLFSTFNMFYCIAHSLSREKIKLSCSFGCSKE